MVESNYGSRAEKLPVLQIAALADQTQTKEIECEAEIKDARSVMQSVMRTSVKKNDTPTFHKAALVDEILDWVEGSAVTPYGKMIDSALTLFRATPPANQAAEK